LTSSILNSNGTNGSGTMRIQASTVGTFTSLIQSNNIVDMNGNAIQFLTQSSGLGASSYTSDLQRHFGLHERFIDRGANWNGSVIANITSNTLYAMART